MPKAISYIKISKVRLLKEINKGNIENIYFTQNANKTELFKAINYKFGFGELYEDVWYLRIEHVYDLEDEEEVDF